MTNCHPTFSVGSCDWNESATVATRAVYSGVLVSSLCALFSLSAALITRLIHIGWGFNIIVEGSLGCIVGQSMHVVLFLGIASTNGSSSPFPFWLATLLWTLPFALVLRTQNLAFHTILQPLSNGVIKLSELKVRLFAATPTCIGAALAVSMSLVSQFLAIGWKIELIFAAGYGSIAMWNAFLAARAYLCVREHTAKSSVVASSSTDRQARVDRFTRWMVATITVNSLWVVSFVVRHLIHVLDTTTQEHPPPSLWLLWISIDALWILVSNSFVAIMTQRDDITDHTSDIVRPTALVYMGDTEDGKAATFFLHNFTEEEVQLSLSSEQPIFRRLPHSWSELIQWPHPINEAQNRMHAGIISLVHLPISILLINYANFPWYLLAVLIGVFLRFAFAYRVEPQSWLVLYVSNFFEPQWAPGPPKRFSSFLSVCMLTTCVALAFSHYTTLASWILCAHIILSFNQMLGWCLGCGIFFVGTRIGLVPEEVCTRCTQRFVKEVRPSRSSQSFGTTTASSIGSRSA